MGESFLSGLDPSVLGEQLRDLGMLLLEDLNGDQSVARYDPTRANGLQSNGVAHIAHARIVGCAEPRRRQR